MRAYTTQKKKEKLNLTTIKNTNLKINFIAGVVNIINGTSLGLVIIKMKIDMEFSPTIDCQTCQLLAEVVYNAKGCDSSNEALATLRNHIFAFHKYEFSIGVQK